MLSVLILLLAVSAAALAWRIRARRQTRARLLAAPLSDRQRAIVTREVPLLHRLPPALRQPLEGKVNLFLHQVSFQGCDGLEVSDDMRLSIAAQACLLVVNSPTWYDNLTTVLIYPGAFRSRTVEHHGYVVTERETVRVGESWHGGPVILSWADTERGAANDHDGHNVVFHEFAHKLDDLSRRDNGASVLGDNQSFAQWARVFSAAYNRHKHRVDHGTRTVTDAYGATSTQEYFAVSVEAFFEKPDALAHDEPEVYAQLAALFRLDPRSWN